MKLLSVLSGGMDSTAALFNAIRNKHEVVGAISFYYGSKHNDREWVSAQQVASAARTPIKRCCLDFMAQNFSSDLLKSGGKVPEGHYADPSMKRTVVPFRNGIMLSIAAGYAESIGAQGILLGNHFGDHAIYPDCRESFVRPMAEAIAAGTYAKIELVTPFTHMSKTQVAIIGSESGAPFHLTYSCYNGREKHCGKCGTCFERKEAFSDAKIPDPTEYEV